MTLEEIVRALMAHADQGEAVAALQAHGQPLFQRVWNAGHKKATDEGKTKRTELETRITELTADVEARVATIADLEKRQPDLAKIRADHAAEVAKLKERHAAETTTLKGQIQSTRETTVLERFGSKLKALADDDWADVQALKNKGRLRFREDGGVDVLQSDGTTPYAPKDGQDALDLLVADIAKAAPAKFLKGTTDTGNGGPAAGGSTSGGGGNARGDQFFDGIRKEAEAEQKAHAPGATTSAAARLGIPGAVAPSGGR